MDWNATVASTCRYGDVAGRIFKDAEIIWEDSESNYQGHANVLAFMPDKTFVHYTWTYGSCSGCDEWESRGLSDEQVEAEMRGAMGVLPDVSSLMRYLKLEDKDAQVPTANTVQNGSVSGMLYMGFGGFGESFGRMRAAAEKWIARHNSN